jgi:phosphatidylglycerol:prolipoprotein diacylglycerol transferase
VGSLLSILLVIEIGIDPELLRVGGLLITWHGVFTALGIAAGVWLGVTLAKNRGFTEDDALNVALVAVPAGIIGARLLFVAENYDLFVGNWIDVLKINEGGISIYGAFIGGALAAIAFGLIKGYPVLRGADAGGLGFVLGLSIGRIGDVINGEHFAKPTEAWYGVVYTHPNSPSFLKDPQHLAVGYELAGLLVILGALLVLRRFFPRDGQVFFASIAAYAVLRFFVSYLRLDNQVLLGLTMAQGIALVLLPIGILGFVLASLRARRVEDDLPAREQPVPSVRTAGARR